MRSNLILLQRVVRGFSLPVLMTVMACGLLLAAAQAASAQCAPNPTGETAVGLKNASSYYLTFYIDGVRKDGVPPGDRSVDFVVTPGEHTLRADATIDGETVSASRTGDVPAGHVCTWTVTDSPDKADGSQWKFRDGVGHALRRFSARRGARRRS